MLSAYNSSLDLTDWIGVGTLVIGTMIGLMAPRIGIRRSHGMGVILVPIMMYTFARELDDSALLEIKIFSELVGVLPYTR